MPVTAAIVGKGTKIGYATNIAGLSSPTFIAEVTDIKVPEVSCPGIECTNYESPSGFTEMISSGWTTASEFQIEVTYAATQSLAIYALVGVEKGWKILLPNAASFVFLGHISKMGTEVPNKDKVKQMITIAPHGVVTFA